MEDKEQRESSPLVPDQEYGGEEGFTFNACQALMDGWMDKVNVGPFIHCEAGRWPISPIRSLIAVGTSSHRCMNRETGE